MNVILSSFLFSMQRSQIFITDIRNGSTIVQFIIIPANSSTPLDAQSILSELTHQISNVSSPLSSTTLFQNVEVEALYALACWR